MPSTPSVIVVLGTGGTISARADSPQETLAYRAGEVGVDQLVADAGVVHTGFVIETGQVAQIDSKDMDFATWRRLAESVAAHLARDEVHAVVVTHGTDTLEETAWFLQRVLAPTQPVVLTAAMRPASAADADGPRNLNDAIAVAASIAASVGVVAVLAGSVHSARDVRKVHPTRLDAFASGDAGPIGRIEHGCLSMLREPTPWPGHAIGVDCLPIDVAAWPWVEIVTSAAGSDARAVDALAAAGCDGIVVAATGNGSVHRALEAALARACSAGLAIVRGTRCQNGSIVESTSTEGRSAYPSAGDLTPQKARVEMLLELLSGTLKRRRE